MVNNIQVEGWIQFDPELKTDKMCVIKIANIVENHKSYFTVLCFGTLAQNVKSQFQKGDFIYVNGTLSSRKYNDKMIVEIRADNVLNNNTKMRNKELGITSEPTTRPF